MRARAAQVAAARARLSEAAASSDGPRELGVDTNHFPLGREMRPPSLVPRGIRLVSPALAHTPMRCEPAHVRGPQGGRATGHTSEAHQATELTGRRKPGRPKSKMAHTFEVTVPYRDGQNEAVTASGEDAEMMDIPTEEGQDTDMTTSSGRSCCNRWAPEEATSAKDIKL